MIKKFSEFLSELPELTANTDVTTGDDEEEEVDPETETEEEEGEDEDNEPEAA